MGLMGIMASLLPAFPLVSSFFGAGLAGHLGAGAVPDGHAVMVSALVFMETAVFFVAFIAGMDSRRRVG
jgi:hypothetical protein